jgi:lysophospholipase L1-like esterase
MASRAGTVLKRTVFTLLTVLVCFAVLDTAYRLVRKLTRPPGQEAIFEPDPVLGRRHAKNARATVVEWSKTTPNQVSINEFGFRGPAPRTLEKPPGVIRVVVQGGSTTEDIFTDDGRSWPEQLQAKLNARLKTDRIEVINMGTSGYTATNCVNDLKLHGLRLKPDLVVTYHGVNDFRKTMAQLNDLEPIEAYVKYEERATSWWSRLLCCSCIVDQANRYNYYRGGARSREHTLAYWHDPDKRDVNVKGIEGPTLQALDELLRLSRQHHFKLVIGRQATLMKPTHPDEEVPRLWRLFRWKYQGKCISWQSFLEGRRRVVDSQARFAKQHRLCYIDTEAAVPKTTEYFVDDAHTAGEGADRISDSFADGLMKSGILEELLGGRTKPKPEESAEGRRQTNFKGSD